MDKDEIIRMARDAGAIQVDGKIAFYEDGLERFAALFAAHEKKFWMEQIEVECNEAVLAEREACAKVCEEYTDNDIGAYADSEGHGYSCAASIRARSKHG